MDRRHLLAAPLLGLCAPALAQGWPSRPVTLVVPFGAGSAADILGRMLAELLSPRWGQPVVVQNIPGASSTIGVDRVAKAPPDGHALALSGDGAIVVRPSMEPPPPYDPVRDLTGVSLLVRTRNLIAVNPAIPVRTLAELVDLARARPGELSYGHTGLGFSQHLAMEMLKQRAGIDITGVPYPNPAQLVPDLLQGRLSMTCSNGPVLLPRLQSGELRAIAVTSPDRMPQAAAVPTVAEQGFPGFDVNAWFGVLAPARTPPEVVARLHRDLATLLAEPAIRERVEGMGLVPVASDPASFTAMIPGEIARMAAVLRPLGLLRGG